MKIVIVTISERFSWAPAYWTPLPDELVKVQAVPVQVRLPAPLIYKKEAGLS